MAKEAKELISNVQPRHTGDMTLWDLHSLDIVDKHRLIIAAQLGSNNWGVSLFSREGPLLWFDTTEFDMVANDVIVNMPIETYRRHQHEGFKLALEVAFSQTEILPREPILATLNQMAHFVRNVVSMFERFIN